MKSVRVKISKRKIQKKNTKKNPKSIKHPNWVLPTKENKKNPKHHKYVREKFFWTNLQHFIVCIYLKLVGNAFVIRIEWEVCPFCRTSKTWKRINEWMNAKKHECDASEHAQAHA